MMFRFTIPSGVYGLLGENGAGKTTLMRVLATLLKPTSGDVLMNHLVYRESNYPSIQKKIGYLPQELSLYPNLTVRECLEYLGGLSGIPKDECKKRLDYYLEETSLEEHQKKKMKQLSGGMKRRVGLIQALLNEPEFLIVDEPTTGLDPEERIRIRNLLVEFAVGRTVLFSTHVVEDLAATCSQLTVLKKGKMLYSGSVKELLKRAEGHTWICRMEEEAQVRSLERELPCFIQTDSGGRDDGPGDQSGKAGCSLQPGKGDAGGCVYLCVKFSVTDKRGSGRGIYKTAAGVVCMILDICISGSYSLQEKGALLSWLFCVSVLLPSVMETVFSS